MQFTHPQRMRIVYGQSLRCHLPAFTERAFFSTLLAPHRYDINPSGKTCVVLGRSNIVGMPMVCLLQSMNGTVTCCHSRTPNIPEIVRSVRRRDEESQSSRDTIRNILLRSRVDSLVCGTYGTCSQLRAYKLRRWVDSSSHFSVRCRSVLALQECLCCARILNDKFDLSPFTGGHFGGGHWEERVRAGLVDQARRSGD